MDNLTVLLVDEDSFDINLTSDLSVIDKYPTYDGPYTVTPTQETQTLEIQNKRATENITINPIPDNYGLITWNGSFITVS